MSKKHILFTILLLTYLNSFSQNIPNDTIVKKDGTKIIDNFKTITVHKNYLITSKYEISIERIESINEKDLTKIAIPLKEIDKVIANGIYLKKRKFLNENDVIWESETNNNKRKVWDYTRSERKTVVLPNGKIKLLLLLVEGKCDLYLDFSPGNSSNFVFYHYYFKKEKERKSTLFKGELEKFFTTTFDTSARGEFIKSKNLDYFDDCTKAKEFIKTKNKLSQKGIIELVKLYNEYCY